MTTLYGIKNCDTMKKARTWLDSQGVSYRFHDYRAEGVQRQWLAAWCGKVGWQVLLNRAGTTFRKLPQEQREGVDEASAIELMLAQPAMIKRPVLALDDGRLIVGFKPEIYQAELAG